MRELKESGLLVVGSLKPPKMCKEVELDRSGPMSYSAKFHLLFAQHETRNQTVKA
jgi:hypothetical protein